MKNSIFAIFAFCGFAALAAPPAGYTNDTYTSDGVTWKRHGALNVRSDYVVTDTTAGTGSAEGLATTNDLAFKRDKTDMAVYEERLDGTPSLPDDMFPATVGGVLYQKSQIHLALMTEDHPWYEAITDDGIVAAWFDSRGYFFILPHANGGLYNGKEGIPGVWPKLTPMKPVPTGDRLATTGEVAAVEAKVDEGLAYSKGVYTYMSANTNAWFAGTNYVVGADAESRYRFRFEDGMDLGSVPCSMALWEIREGERQCVWDQRDWVAWYWSFKAGQMQAEIAATNAAIFAAMPVKSWSSYTAKGLDNPDPTTTWVDTENVTLAAGFAWQTVANVSGCAYWTIVGNGATLGASGTNTVLEIRDFEGKAVMRIVKGESYLAYVDSSSMTGQGRDSQGRVTFDLVSNVQPVGEFSTTLNSSDFVVETDPNCPADYEWENLGSGTYRIHFLLKSGIVSPTCFARFKVAVERDSTIEYTTAPTISGGLIYNGVKIVPVINGSDVSWKVAQ